MKPLISKRNFLRGAGVAVALPWLESLAPRGVAAQPGVRKRFMPIYLPSGAPEVWRPQTVGQGAAWQLSSVMAPLAPLKSNPFPDATEDFFGAYETALNLATDGHLRIVRPFGQLSKTQVMELGSKYPLGLTFSCIAPVGELHCGRCNKCAERRKAFTSAGLTDPTGYAV